MSEITPEHLSTCALAALERSAFVFADLAEETEGLPEPLAYACIVCSGAVEGELYLAASEGFLRELAASLLGEEPGEVDPETQGADALKEMANMIAGSVILCGDGADKAYTLGLPQVGSRKAFDKAARTGLVTTLVTSGEPLTLVWNGRAKGVKAVA